MKLGSTRQAIHDALSWGFLQKESGLTDFLTYLTQIEKSKRPNNAAVDLVEAAYVCAAIDSLKPHLGGWLKFAYGPEDLSLTQTILATKLRSDLFPISSVKKHLKMLSLSSVSLEDYRLRLRRYRDMPDIVYCERIGIAQPHFYRDGWGDRRKQCLDTLKNWDKDGVGQVSRVVKALRGESEDETASEILQDIANGK